MDEVRKEAMWMLDYIWDPLFDNEVAHLIPEVVEEAWDEAFQKLKDAVCAAFGHEYVDDMCNIPEHRYCYICMAGEFLGGNSE